MSGWRARAGAFAPPVPNRIASVRACRSAPAPLRGRLIEGRPRRDPRHHRHVRGRRPSPEPRTFDGSGWKPRSVAAFPASLRGESRYKSPHQVLWSAPRHGADTTAAFSLNAASMSRLRRGIGTARRRRSTRRRPPRRDRNQGRAECAHEGRTCQSQQPSEGGPGPNAVQFASVRIDEVRAAPTCRPRMGAATRRGFPAGPSNSTTRRKQREVKLN